jgi:hypothetical protein
MPWIRRGAVQDRAVKTHEQQLHRNKGVVTPDYRLRSIHRNEIITQQWSLETTNIEASIMWEASYSHSHSVGLLSPSCWGFTRRGLSV